METLERARRSRRPAAPPWALLSARRSSTMHLVAPTKSPPASRDQPRRQSPRSTRLPLTAGNLCRGTTLRFFIENPNRFAQRNVRRVAVHFPVLPFFDHVIGNRRILKRHEPTRILRFFALLRFCGSLPGCGHH